MGEARRAAEWDRVAWHLANVAAMLGSKSPNPADFLPEFSKPKPLPVDTGDALRAFAKAIGAVEQ